MVFINTKMEIGKLKCFVLYPHKSIFRFEGEMNKGEFSGESLFFFGSLDKYNGDFTGGRLEGRGKMTYRDGHIYTGQFQNWKQNGQGKMVFRNGDIVEGVWTGETGIGTITYTDGSMYEVGLDGLEEYFSHF